jgi:hypothetical protein
MVLDKEDANGDLIRGFGIGHSQGLRYAQDWNVHTITLGRNPVRRQ